MELKRRLYPRGGSYETTIPKPLLFALNQEKKYLVRFIYDDEKRKWYLDFEESNAAAGVAGDGSVAGDAGDGSVAGDAGDGSVAGDAGDGSVAGDGKKLRASKRKRIVSDTIRPRRPDSLKKSLGGGGA